MMIMIVLFKIFLGEAFGLIILPPVATQSAYISSCVTLDKFLLKKGNKLTNIHLGIDNIIMMTPNLLTF